MLCAGAGSTTPPPGLPSFASFVVIVVIVVVVVGVIVVVAVFVYAQHLYGHSVDSF